MKTRIMAVSIAIIAVFAAAVFGLSVITNNFENNKDIKTQIEDYAKASDVERLLMQNHVDYRDDRLVVASGSAFEGDPGCGATIDVSNQTHWFEINSISQPTRMTLYSENPRPCMVNTSSCFCNAQMEMTAMTLESLSYFTPDEEKTYAEILLDFINNDPTMVNIEPKFRLGKLNLNFTDPNAVGYCGQRPGEDRNGFFSGAIVNGKVHDYGLDRDLPPLCALSEKWWE